MKNNALKMGVNLVATLIVPIGISIWAGSSPKNYGSAETRQELACVFVFCYSTPSAEALWDV